MGNNSWRHPLILLAGAAGVFAIISLIVSATRPDYLSITLLSNIIVFIASGLLSYIITQTNERRQFAEELGKLADFSRRRVNILSENLTSLTEEIRGITAVDEIKRLVGYTLGNLEQDARASVRDIEGIGGIVSIAQVDDGPILQIAPQPEDAPPVEIVSTAPAEQQVFCNCPKCGYSNATFLSTAPGSTRHVTCSNCESRWLVHRLAGGTYRVVNPYQKRLSNFAIAPSPATARPHGFPEPTAEGAATATASSELDSFVCPRCQGQIPYRPGADRVIEKPCFSCLAVASYDRELKIARLVQDKRPIYLDRLATETMECHSCHTIFRPRVYSSNSGKQFICCFRCNAIYLEKSQRKQEIELRCPTDGCNNIVSFRVKEGEHQARQFCMECFSRLLYDRETGQATLIEKLTVPSVKRLAFAANGSACPHCGQLASDRYKVNSRGQRISICWSCKNIFEFTD
jgi:hypothetical protein